MSDGTDDIRPTILKLVRERGLGKTICPSEVARAIAGKDEKKWRLLMKPIKKEAAEMAASGDVVIKRKGKPIDPTMIRGIYRLGLPD